VTGKVRQTISRISDADRFNLDKPHPDGGTFSKRIRLYEELTTSIGKTVALLGKWADSQQHAVLGNVFARLSDHNLVTSGGYNVWVGLRWYPISYLMYLGGIAAISSKNFESFAMVHLTKIENKDRGEQKSVELILPVIDGRAYAS
jgi:hypothetical protein